MYTLTYVILFGYLRILKMAETESDPSSDTEDAALMDVNVDIVAVLGTAELKISQILQLGRGAVVELERLVGEPVELRAEGRLVARGEVVVTDEKLAVQISEVIKTG